MSEVTLRPIVEVARDLDLPQAHLRLYGQDKAKISLQAHHTGRPAGKLILVSAITPTRAGEGKTTTAIGLAQGLAKLGQRVCLALREPSLGPTLGIKGGGTGGGLSTLEPHVDINLHFTGDFHAVSAAHNLLAALIDNHIHHGNKLGIDPRCVYWRRVLDLNDRALRHVVIGLGGVLEGVPRETGFDITAASEVMAALCLARDGDDLRKRLGKMVLALSFDRQPVTTSQVGGLGAMMALLKDALLPNLVQTREGVPAFVHGGPFANIAHGCNSVIATKLALATANWVVTEAGFGFDLGAEKFYDIKCVSAGLDTAAVVLVATVRALKVHGGVAWDQLEIPDPAAVERGLVNLEKHIDNIRVFDEPPIVALNRFDTDTQDEIAVVRRACERMGVPFGVSEVFAKGGAGGTALAEMVMAHAQRGNQPFRPLYQWSQPIKEKMDRIAKLLYGAGVVNYTQAAQRDLALIERLGYAGLPLCVAKTASSLTDDPTRTGRPQDFDLTVDRVLLAAGAGYLVPMLGHIIRMPGLPASPQADRIDLVDGHVTGLS